MERLKLLVAVAGHGLGERMGAALEGAGCAVCFHLSGQGTAKAAWLEMLGLSDTRKDVLIAPCPEGRVAPALAALRAHEAVDCMALAPLYLRAPQAERERAAKEAKAHA